MSRGYTLRYSIVQFAKETNGIKESKHKAKKEYGGISPKIHSFATKTRYFGIINDFVDWLYRQGIKRVNQVTTDKVIQFLREKAFRTTQKTMRTNMAALKKFFQSSPWVEKRELVEAIEAVYHEILYLARESGEAKPFSNPERVIDHLKEPQHKSVATIQIETGARIDDVPKVANFMINQTPGKDFLIVIEKSKGGRDRELDFSDRVEKFMRIRDEALLLSIYIRKKGWRSIKEEYYEDLKNAASALKETYTGAHAFRVNYAQRRIQELLERGLPEKEALKIVTKELGHNRVSMAKSYVNR